MEILLWKDQKIPLINTQPYISLIHSSFQHYVKLDIEL